jgi:hypothetical protein
VCVGGGGGRKNGKKRKGSQPYPGRITDTCACEQRRYIKDGKARRVSGAQLEMTCTPGGDEIPSHRRVRALLCPQRTSTFEAVYKYFFLFLGVEWDWVHLVRRPVFGLFEPRMMIGDVCGALSGKRIGKGNRSTRRKPTPAPLRPPQIPHDLGSNPGHRGGKPATSRLRYVQALNTGKVTPALY